MVLPLVASVVDATEAKTVGTKYFWLIIKGGTWYVQEEKDLIKVEYANMRKYKAVETALSVGEKEDYFFFVLVVGCSVLSATGSSFSKAG